MIKRLADRFFRWFCHPNCYGMNGWLQSYAYRIDFPWLLTGVALLIVIFFALLTVGYQVYQVAVLNPAKTLRHE